MFICVANAKVVEDRREHQVAVDMCPQSWGDGTRDIAIGGEKCAEPVVGELSGLGKAVHAFADFGVNVPIVDLAFEFVERNNGWREQMGGDAYVLVVGKVTAEVKILQV